MPASLHHIDVWYGEHADLRYKIHKSTSYNNHPLWCYYLHIHEEQVPDYFESFWLPPKTVQFGSRRPRITHDYMECPLAALDWYGGITFYQKHDNDGKRWVEAGCDFNHLWDLEAGFPHSIGSVQREAENTITMFRQIFPLTRWRCAWNGRYYPRNQGGTTEDGTFYSHEGVADRATKDLSPIEIVE